MDIARLVLDYIKVFIWPAVTLAVVFGFREQVRDLMHRVRVLSGPGIDAEFSERVVAASQDAENAVRTARAGAQQPLVNGAHDPRIPDRPDRPDASGGPWPGALVPVGAPPPAGAQAPAGPQAPPAPATGAAPPDRSAPPAPAGAPAPAGSRRPARSRRPAGSPPGQAGPQAPADPPDQAGPPPAVDQDPSDEPAPLYVREDTDHPRWVPVGSDGWTAPPLPPLPVLTVEAPSAYGAPQWWGLDEAGHSDGWAERLVNSVGPEGAVALAFQELEFEVRRAASLRTADRGPAGRPYTVRQLTDRLAFPREIRNGIAELAAVRDEVAHGGSGTLGREAAVAYTWSCRSMADWIRGGAVTA